MRFREMEFLYKWASERSGEGIFSEPSRGMVSYFEGIDEHEKYLQEYSYNSMHDFRTLVEQLCDWRGEYEDIKTVLLVSILKNTPNNFNSSMENELPTYRYNF